MGLPRYLAMTAAEFHSAAALPSHPGWMACHFSCYGLGLSNMPASLPEGAMIIVNDRTPVNMHDPEIILSQLQELTENCRPGCILLDFQRPDQAQTQKIAYRLCTQLSCPVGVSEAYAKDLECPVFLPPPPLHRPLKDHLKPWNGRQIWLESALLAQTVTVTEKGSIFAPAQLASLPEPHFTDEQLHCSYHIDCRPDAAVFTLLRDKIQTDTLLEEAESLGVTLAVGLYQQLGFQ